MSKCEATDGNLLELKNRLVSEMGDLDPNMELSPSLFQEKCKQYLDKEFKKIASNFQLNKINTIVKYITDALIELDLNNSNDPYFTEASIKSILQEQNRGVINDSASDTSTSILEVPTSVMEIHNNEFLSSSYGYATDVRLNAEKLFRNFVVNSTLIDREKGRVINSASLNSSIKNLQQELLNNIYNYLKLYYITNNEEFNKLLENRFELYSNGEYTKILPQIQRLLDASLSMTSDLLIKCQDSANLGNIKNKAKLLAYNSRVLLYNFDAYLKLVFGENIIINNIGQFQFEDKYAWLIKGVDMNKTWRTSDNINADKEISGVVKLLLNTTKLYGWQDSIPKDNYLKSLDVEYMITKIKLLGYDYRVYDIDLTSPDFSIIIRKLSPETLLVLYESETLGGLLSRIIHNSQVYFSSLFELLSNNEFYEKCTQRHEYNIFDSYKTFDLDIIYSLYKGVFNSNGNESIKAINKNDLDINYYGHISQALNSVDYVQFFQYFVDEKGNYKVRTLLDQSYDSISRTIELSINLIHSKKLEKYNTIEQAYEVTELKDNDNSFIGISFKVGDYKIQIEKSDFKMKIFKNNSEINLFTAEDWGNEDIREFLDTVLKQGLGITKDTSFALAYINEVGRQETAVNNLMTLATRIMFNAYVSNKIFKDVNTKRGLESGINSIYSSDISPKINYDLGEISLICPKDITIIKQLALAKASLNGLITSTIIKTGEGKSLSSVTLGRLLGSYTSQRETQCDSEESVTKNCLLVKNKRILKGIYATRELKNQNSVKTYTDFNVGEFSYSSFIFDFIGGLVSVDERYRHVIGNGVVSFLASCNSDKSEIDKLVIDLNESIDGVKLVDANTETLRALINKEFGEIYTNMIKKVVSDLTKLFNSMGIKLTKNPILDDFREANLKILEKTGESPYTAILKAISKFNNVTSTEFINFTDLLYFTNNGGNLKANISLISLVNRFNPQYIFEEESKLNDGTHYITYLNPKYLDSKSFWREQNISIITDLLDNGFKIDFTKESLETSYLKSKYPDWGTNSMIIAKYNYNGEVYPIYSNIDIEYLSRKLNIDKTTILNNLELHPLIERFNLLNYLFQEEFLITSVGSHVNHPSKYKGDDPIIDESLRKKAQNKRNVLLTATVHRFMLGDSKGIPDEYNIAVIKDVTDRCYNVAGEIEKGVKPFDGATFVHPIIVYLENNSLGASKVGYTKKPFIHFYNEKTGTGGIIKTAGFAITNDTIRNSEMDMILMKKTSSFEWKTKDGFKFYTDISKVNYGSRIFYKTKNGFVEVTKIEPILENGELTNRYTVYERFVDEHGEYISEEKPTEKIIDTIYKLWKVFGGEQSCELVNNNLEYSENSIIFSSLAMNELVNPLDKTDQPLKHSIIHYIVTEGAIKQGASNINTNDAFFDEELPLSFMKIKMYNSGVLLDKEHHASDSELSLMTLVIQACAARGYSFKRANDVFVALANQSQFLSKKISQACSLVFNSNTNTESLQKIINRIIIDSLASKKSDESNYAVVLAKNILKKLRENPGLTGIHIPFSDNTVYNQLISAISVVLTNSGIKSKIPGILAVLTPSYKRIRLFGDHKLEYFADKSEIEKLQNEKYNHSLFSINLPNFSIRQDLTKPLSSIENGEVLINRENISFDEFISYFKGDDGTPKSELNKSIYEYLAERYNLTDELLAKIFNNPTNILKYLAYKEHAKLQDPNYRTYFLEEQSQYEDWSGENDPRNNWYSDVKIKIESHSSLTALSKFIDLNLSNIEMGRTYKVIINNNGINNIESHFIETPIDYFKFKDTLQEYAISGFNFEIIEDITKGRELGAYNVRFTGKLTRQYLLYDLDSSKALFELKEFIDRKEEVDFNFISSRINIDSILSHVSEKNVLDKLNSYLNGDTSVLPELNSIFNNNYTEIILRRILQSDLFALSKDHDNNIVYINKNRVEIIKSSINVSPYEVIMPKVFIKEFGLKKYDDLQTIKNDRAFFIKRMMENYRTKLTSEMDFDIELKNNNGEHYYILNKKHLNQIQNIFEATAYFKTNEDGKIFRINHDGYKIFYEMYSEDDKIYTDKNGIEVIVTDHPEFYINKLHYDLLTFSARDSFPYTEYMELIKDIDSASESYDYLNSKEKTGLVNVRNSNLRLRNAFQTDISNMSLEQIEEESLINYALLIIYKKGLLVHTSFLKSLDIIAARIPAQNMQSFMPMKVVGFENPDINNAYVSTALLWLQGSDFDIDSVSLATFAITKNGKLALWSPYAKLTTLKELELSLELPYPTGEDVKFEVSDKLEDWQLESLIHFLNVADDAPNNLVNLKYLLENYNNIKIPSKSYFLTIKEKFGYDYDKLTKKIKHIKSILDKHNLYIQDNRNIDLIMHNYMMHALYSVAINPVNLLEAQSSVDSVTSVPKSVADSGSVGKNRENSGNFINTIKDIYRNQIGKKEVGISANALKVFFATSHYFNTILNSGDDIKQSRLVFKSRLLGDSTIPRLIANVHALNSNTVVNEEVKKAMLYLNQDVDSSNLLSAMLSLAVDNAKDPKLSKLNSTIRSASLYLYGIMIGMDFKNIANLLMSDVGRMMTSLIDGNIFNGTSMSFTSLLSYFTLGPIKKLLEFDKQIYDYESRTMLNSPLLIFFNSTNIDEIEDFLMDERTDLYYKLNIIEQASNVDILNDKVKNKYHELIDFLKEYCKQYDIYRKNKEAFYHIIDLSEGAAEITILSRILNLNKGIPTKQEELLDIIYSFENCVQNRYDLINLRNRINKSPQIKDHYKVDLLNFVYNEHARNGYIEHYNRYKHTINILDVVANVPHFMQYLTRLADAYIAISNSSARFRFIRNKGEELTQKKSSKKRKDILKGLSNYSIDYIINSYFLDKNTYFVLPKGQEYFVNGKLTSAETDTKIYLGTKDGNASFKRWVELSVMPRLNLRKTKFEKQVAHNVFIESLQPIIYTYNSSLNPSINYSIPVNMLPRNDSERMVFNSFKSEFNKLYKYNYTETPKFEIPLIKLLFYYNLITYSNKLGESSLTAIFANQSQNPDIQNYFDYVGEFDRKFEITDSGDILNSGLIYYITSRDNPFFSTEEYIFYKPSSEFITKLWKRKEKLNNDYDDYDYMDDIDYDDEYSNLNNYGNYTLVENLNSNLNYFTKPLNLATFRVIVPDVGVNRERINVEIKGNKIVSINGDSNITPIPVPYVKTTSKIDMSLLKMYVEHYINNCG